jgi:hypothetical protein
MRKLNTSRTTVIQKFDTQHKIIMDAAINPVMLSVAAPFEYPPRTQNPELYSMQ